MNTCTHGFHINFVLLLCSTLIQKQKRQGIHGLERIGLEKITLLTLQLICGIIFKQIAKVPRGSLSPEDFKQYTVLMSYPKYLYH